MSKNIKKSETVQVTLKNATATKHKSTMSSVKEGFYVGVPLWSDCHLSLIEIKGSSELSFLKST